MPDTVSKTDNFLKAIEKYAEAQRTRLQTEAEEFKETELNKAEEEGIKEAYVLIQRQMASVRTEIARELSKAEGESRKEIFRKRQEIEDSVFAKAEERILAYTKTEKYVQKLLASVKAVAGVLDSDDVILYVTDRDRKYEDKIRKAFGRACEVQTDKSIRLGGVIGKSAALGLLADETLDTRLSEQHEWFYEHSGLYITG